MDLNQTLTQVGDIVQTVSLIVLTVSGILAAFGVKKTQALTRMEKAAEAAVHAVEQARKVRAKQGRPIEASALKELALHEVANLLPDLTPTDTARMKTLLEAAVQKMQPTKKGA